MFRYVLQRSLTYLVMVFITTTMGYFAAVITLQPALLEQEKFPGRLQNRFNVTLPLWALTRAKALGTVISSG